MEMLRFANLDNGFFLKEIVKIINNIGYKIVSGGLNTAEYGIPQKEKGLLANKTGNIIHTAQNLNTFKT